MIEQERIKEAFDRYYSNSMKRAVRRKNMVQENKYPIYNEYERLLDEYNYPYSINDITYSHFPKYYKDKDELKKLLSVEPEKQYKDIEPVNPRLILDYYKELCGIEWPCVYSRYFDEIIYPDEPYSPFRLYLSNNWIDDFELEDLDRVMDSLGYFRQNPNLSSHSSWKSCRLIRYWPYSQIVSSDNV